MKNEQERKEAGNKLLARNIRTQLSKIKQVRIRKSFDEGKLRR